jgi:HEAT repeat protein
MKQFSEALNQHSHISAYDIRSYLDAFGWEALGPITDILGDLEHRIHRELLCDLLSAKGKDNIAIIAKGVHDKRWFVVRNSVNILARMNDDKALGYLAPALKHEDRRVRLEVLSAIKDRTDARVMDILRKALLDKDAEVRQIALTHLMTHPIDGSFEAVSTMIGDAAFQSLERPEQADVLKAYSILGSERAVPFLKKLATRMNTFNDVQLSFLRTAAFTALAHNPSRTAESLLVRLRSSWSPRIRRCAREAIGHRREIMVRQAVHPSGVDLKQDSSEAAHVR